MFYRCVRSSEGRNLTCCFEVDGRTGLESVNDYQLGRRVSVQQGGKRC